MNNLDKDYTNLLQDILDNGVKKETRNGSTISVFGRQIRHKMSEGFPSITSKKIYFKGIVTELLWFLRGDTNIKFLVDNDCHIWDGDAYKNYEKNRDRFSNKDNVKEDVVISGINGSSNRAYTQEEFINKIKTDTEFAKKWGDLGPVYGSGWRNFEGVDQISELIDGLKTNPDSRRLRVSAWQPHKLKDMVLPPCHTDFQVYTRELSLGERRNWCKNNNVVLEHLEAGLENEEDDMRANRVPIRTISLMFNMRSNDVPLGLPFNIASYALLLEIIGKMVNMVPDELIGNLGDCHVYLNQIDGVKEQIGRELRVDERICMCYEDSSLDLTRIQEGMSDLELENICNEFGIPKRTREPFPLPKLGFNKSSGFFRELGDDLSLLSNLDISDFMVENYQSHPTIKFPLSN
jgi:thymidylate synthase